MIMLRYFECQTIFSRRFEKPTATVTIFFRITLSLRIDPLLSQIFCRKIEVLPTQSKNSAPQLPENREITKFLTVYIRFVVLHFKPKTIPSCNSFQTFKSTPSYKHFEPHGRCRLWPFFACSMLKSKRK